MTTLKNKIDFIVTIDVENANPNGDPLMGNMPRTTNGSYGFITDVAIKRKIRNRLQDMCDSDQERQLFVQPSDRPSTDGQSSFTDRFNAVFPKTTEYTLQELIQEINKTWIDVRSFGQVFALSEVKVKNEKPNGKPKKANSIGIRGPISISPAYSVEPITVTNAQITCSTNLKSTDNTKDSNTMGMKYFIEKATYVIKGSISPRLAETTGFSEDDMILFKEALRTLFENDQSSARPSGSMTVRNIYWFTHSNKLGNASSANIFKLVSYDETSNEFLIDSEKLKAYENNGLTLDIIEGF